jgi:hypothetical protein
LRSYQWGLGASGYSESYITAIHLYILKPGAHTKKRWKISQGIGKERLWFEMFCQSPHDLLQEDGLTLLSLLTLAPCLNLQYPEASNIPFSAVIVL